MACSLRPKSPRSALAAAPCSSDFLVALTLAEFHSYSNQPAETVNRKPSPMDSAPSFKAASSSTCLS